MAADNGSAQGTTVWPVPEFHFSVEISNVGAISCKEVSGLETEYDVLEYRAGDSPEFTKTKQPGLRKTSDITLKKGIFKSDKKMWDYIGKIKMNTIQRETVTVKLLDESGDPVQSWEITNAWPKKMQVEGFKAEGNSVAMETMILAHEGVKPI